MKPPKIADESLTNVRTAHRSIGAGTRLTADYRRIKARIPGLAQILFFATVPETRPWIHVSCPTVTNASDPGGTETRLCS